MHANQPNFRDVMIRHITRGSFRSLVQVIVWTHGVISTDKATLSGSHWGGGLNIDILAFFTADGLFLSITAT